MFTKNNIMLFYYFLNLYSFFKKNFIKIFLKKIFLIYTNHFKNNDSVINNLLKVYNSKKFL